MRSEPVAQAVTEELAPEIVNGVGVKGFRITITIPTGAFGNDREVKVINERWYSDELQTMLLTRRNDPRTGEEVFRLINISRAEPAPYLFQVPAGYQVVQEK